MNIRITSDLPVEITSDCIIIFAYDDGVLPESANGVPKKVKGQLEDILRKQPESKKYGQVTVIYVYEQWTAKQIVLVGLGRAESLTGDKIRAVAAIAMRSAQKLSAATVSVAIDIFEAPKFKNKDTIQAIAEGAILGLYQFNQYKTPNKAAKTIEALVISVSDNKKVKTYQRYADNAVIIAESVNFAKDLVNHPACYLTPDKLAWYAKQVAGNFNLDIRILDEKDMQERGMAALLSVARGSNEEPKCIVIKYIGDESNEQLLALIGKGVTFDSGGISLKPSENMGAMKGDMAGGASVIATMSVIGQIKPKINVVGIIPCVENMPSGHALKPGDVVRSMSGKTIEIISTDAEGRLLIADAITYAKKMGATHLVDIATLTGACVVALGDIASGVIGNDTGLCDILLTAAAKSGEKMWLLPSFDEYNEQIKSDIADLKNSGGRMAGVITAGLFIGAFADNTPWVHIDIAGTSTSNKIAGYCQKGATGVGVRTLVQLAIDMGKI